ncbi:MAG: DUF1501 domain-containing protein [Opitutus sp.]|nr:DUF1501 domain-containing protein [Opitutus sp.]
MNSKTSTPDLSRRKFLGACCASVGATGMLSTLAQLRLIGAVADSPPTPGRAAAPQTDFKALVCLFLAGGNDANNLIVPTDPSTYTAYATGRGALALPQSSVLPITPRTNDGRSWGLHPSLGINPNGTTNGGLKGLFDRGRLALLANVGALSYPLTKAEYTARPDLRPLQLFSHNDQQVEWQSSIADKPFTTGWGGRLADLTNAFNANNRISMSITLNGQNSFQVGRNVAQYAVGTNGAIALTGSGTGTSVNGIRTAAMNDALAMQNANLFETAFAGLTNSAVSNSALLTGVVSGTSPFASYFTGLNSNLSQQLHMIARLVNAQQTLGLRRQIFFARIGGWDLHDNQVVAGNTATGAHANLFRDVSQAVTAFYSALASVGADNQVTTFTASDFGRTYNTNGDGSDHGWGSHHFVVGGAVNGGEIYGLMPAFDINGPDDTGRGRWIPSTSVDEYSATLAKWFGVSGTNLPVVLPNIGRFAKPDLGFMAA